jgi:hypothetical protein
LHAEVPCSVGYEARRLNRARHHLAAASGLDRDRRCFHEVLVGDPGLHQELAAEPVIGEFVPAATHGGSGSARTHGLRREFRARMRRAQASGVSRVVLSAEARRLR